MEADLEYVGSAVAPMGGRREAVRGPGTATGSGSGRAPAHGPGTASGPASASGSASGSARLPGVGTAAADEGDAPGANDPRGGASALGWLRHLADGDRLAVLDDDALLADLRLLEEAGHIVDAGRMFAAGLVAQRCETSTGEQPLCTREGFTKAEDMIAQVTGTSTNQARHRIRQAEPLQHTTSGPAGTEDSGNGQDGARAGAGGVVPFPRLRLALRGGLISPETAHVITTALTPALGLGIPPGRVGEAECTLLVSALGADVITTHAPLFGRQAPDVLTEAERSHTQARGGSLTQLTRLARSWNRVLAQEAPPMTGEAVAREVRGRQEARRSLTIHPPRDGTRRVEGELLPETAAQLERLLDAYLNPRTDTGAHQRAGTSRPGESQMHAPSDSDAVTRDGADVEERGSLSADPRNARQKRHDALAGILTQAAGLPTMPLMGGGAPTLVITTTHDQLHHPQGVAFLQGSHHEADSDVDITVAHHTGCVGAVQKILLDPGGRILELGTPQRTFTTHQRRAIATRDGGCIIPGCAVPATWCEIHHVHEWQHGGPTHIDNGVALCWHHHRTLDQLGWDIRMRDGIPWVRPPTTIDPQRRWHPAQSSLHHTVNQLVLRHPDTPAPTGSAAAGPPSPDTNGTGPPTADRMRMSSPDGRSTPGVSRTSSPAPDEGGVPASIGTSAPTPDSGAGPEILTRRMPTTAAGSAARGSVMGTPTGGAPPPLQNCRAPDTPDTGELRAPPHVQEHLFTLSG